MDRIGRGGQIKIYTAKCFRAFIHEKGWKALISTLLISLIIALVIGDKTFSIWESTKSGVFAMICGCIWTGLFNSIRSVCGERAIVKREHRTGLHISSYIIAHMIYEFVLCVAEGLIMTVAFALCRDFPRHGVFSDFIALEFFISFTLVIFCADVLGIMVSCIVKSENTAMTVMPFVLIIQLVLAGTMFELPKNALWMRNLTISRWGLTAVCSSADINDLPTRTEVFFDEDDPMAEAFIEGTMPSDMDDYDATASNVVLCWAALLGYSALYAGVGILFLKQVDKDKR